MLRKWIVTIIAAGLSAYAAGVVAQYGTPVDSALPLIAVVITIVAAVSHPLIQLAVPLLLGGEIAIADERVRLVWFGVVIAAAFGSAMFGEMKWERAAVLTIAAILLLRWIPIANVSIWREVLLIAVALLIAVVMRGTPIGVAIGIATALFTPLIPLRTIGFALAVLVVLVAFRIAGMPDLRFPAVSAFAIAILMVFFAWSGVLARAPKLALAGLPVSTPRAPVRMALAPGQSVSLDVPPDATAVILSGANMSRLRPGTIVGTINQIPVRIGDIADWGFLRREHFHKSRNRVPENPAGELRDYGQNAWIDGAARFQIRGPKPEARGLVVRADAGLPAGARLQIDAFELRSR